MHSWLVISVLFFSIVTTLWRFSLLLLFCRHIRARGRAWPRKGGVLRARNRSDGEGDNLWAVRDGDGDLRPRTHTLTRCLRHTLLDIYLLWFWAKIGSTLYFSGQSSCVSFYLIIPHWHSFSCSIKGELPHLRAQLWVHTLRSSLVSWALLAIHLQEPPQRKGLSICLFGVCLRDWVWGVQARFASVLEGASLQALAGYALGPTVRGVAFATTPQVLKCLRKAVVFSQVKPS